jgi:regulator of protease activity HflC (stomatin/prohibitin superfamily)
MPQRYNNRTGNYEQVGPSGKAWTAIVLGVLGVLLGLILFASSCSTVDQDKVGFTVGGGLIDPDKRKVKSDLLDPGMHITGIADGMWTFPSNKTLRFQDFETSVTTLDSRRLTIKGQVGFRFVGEKDPALAKEFAQGIGARKWGGEKPGENDEGWENFLNALVTPAIRSTLKAGFGAVYCADFEPQCRSIDPRETVPTTNPDKVYEQIATGLDKRIAVALGSKAAPKAYLQDVSLRISTVDVPDEVRQNIDAVTTEQARTKAAVQSKETADAKADAINKLGAALRANKDQIPLEIAKECKGGERCTIIVDASGNGVATSVPAR